MQYRTQMGMANLIHSLLAAMDAWYAHNEISSRLTKVVIAQECPIGLESGQESEEGLFERASGCEVALALFLLGKVLVPDCLSYQLKIGLGEVGGSDDHAEGLIAVAQQHEFGVHLGAHCSKAGQHQRRMNDLNITRNPHFSLSVRGFPVADKGERDCGWDHGQ